MDYKITISRNVPELYREALKNTPLYYQFYYRDYHIYAGQGITMVQDSTIEKLVDMKLLSQNTRESYYEDIKKTINELNWESQFTDEYLYSILADLRSIYLAEEKLDGWNYMAKSSKMLINNNKGIDQSYFEEELLKQTEVVICYLSDPDYFALLMEDIKRYRANGKRIALILKENEMLFTPTRSWAEKAFKEIEGIEFLIDSSFDSLIKLQELKSSEGICRTVEKEGAFMVGYGEGALFSARGLIIPAIIKVVPKSFYGRAWTNQFSHSDLCTIYVPKEFDIALYIKLTEPPDLTYYHLDKLSRRWGKEIYKKSLEEMYFLSPELFALRYEDGRIRSGRIPKPLVNKEEFSRNGFRKAVDDAARAFLAGIHNIDYISAYYREKDKVICPISYENPDKSQGILVTGIIVKKIRNSEVFISPNGAVSPRSYFHEYSKDGRTAFVTNFLFFITPKLKLLYNNLRADRAQEILRVPCGHIDYQRRRGIIGNIETFPLFKKACLGMQEDGSFSIFNYSLGGGRVYIGEKTLNWKEEDVNKRVLQREEEVIIYTPYYSVEDKTEEYNNYICLVGEGRINLVVIDNKINCIRKGTVALPSIGVVISLSLSKADELLTEVLGSMDNKGYYYIKANEIAVNLDPPKGISREKWDKMKWVYGGGLTLIHNGISIFEEGRYLNYLEQEGWLSPLSKQTQESELHTLERHPRTAVGITKNGELFILVFSGRTTLSMGADYKEMCIIARMLIPDIEYMMNVDGGASSMLGLVIDNNLWELSYPAPSDSSSTGQCRPMNTFLYIGI